MAVVLGDETVWRVDTYEGACAFDMRTGRFNMGVEKNKSESKVTDNSGAQIPNMSSVGFPRSLSNALMVGQASKRGSSLRRSARALFARSRRAR
jgi:hypothetical protein